MRWRTSKTVNFRGGFRIEPANILAHQGAHFGVVSHHPSPNVR
jgi:hypothetical protein